MSPREPRADLACCDAEGCINPPRFVTGGGAAASWFYCLDHARDLCACEAWRFGSSDDDHTIAVRLLPGRTHSTLGESPAPRPGRRDIPFGVLVSFIPGVPGLHSRTLCIGDDGTTQTRRADQPGGVVLP